VQWQTAIQLQIQGNKKANLLHKTRPFWFAFNPKTQKLIENITAGALTDTEVEYLIVYTTKAALSSFYQVNQYY
jgi:hypothetical protein